MAIIGSYAGVVFEVSENKILTFDNFERVTEPRWNEHRVLHNKPVPEYEGPGADDISFTILLKAEFGVNPEVQMAKIREFTRKGRKSLFVLGGKPISVNNWIIKKAIERHKNIDNLGNIMQIEVQLELHEDPKAIVTQKKTISNVKKKAAASSTTKKKTLGKITITVKSVNIRSGPGTNNKVLGYAFKNDQLTVYSVKNGWYSLGGGKYITADSKYSTLKKG